MRPRAAPDLDLVRQVSARLAQVLSDQAPRRAAAAPPPLTGESAPPAVDPLDDGQDDELDDLDTGRSRSVRRPFGRTHLGVIVALLLVGLVWGGWTLLRARPVAVADPGGVVISTPVSTSPSSSAAPSTAPALVVHVLGAVRRPGLVSLPEGSRVEDAIRAAGGLTRAADPGELNLAQLLADGEQVVIGTRRKPAGEIRDGGGSPAGGSSAGGSTGGGGATVDLNRATQAELEELPGVGPVTATAILTWRSQHQRFSRVEELQEVDGIGPKTYAQIAPHVRV